MMVHLPKQRNHRASVSSGAEKDSKKCKNVCESYWLLRPISIDKAVAILVQ